MGNTHRVTFQVTYAIEVDVADVENYQDVDPAGMEPEDIAAAMVISDFEFDEVLFVAEEAGEPLQYGVTHVQKVS